MADMEGNEAFDASMLGECQEVAEQRVGDGELIYFRGCKTGQACTVVLRGANEFMLDEMGRSLHDCLCVMKRMLESSSLVACGGAVETALSIYLENFASTLSSREQLAVAQFAEALLVIPRTLTINAAHDATELVAKLPLITLPLNNQTLPMMRVYLEIQIQLKRANSNGSSMKQW